MDDDISEWQRRLVPVRELAAAWQRQPMGGGVGKPMAGNYIDALDQSPFGDLVCDFDRLSATTADPIVRAIEPAVTQVRELLRPKTMTGLDMVAYMKCIEEGDWPWPTDSPDGDRWRRTDLLIPLFGDIRTIRNDYVHNQGVADESTRNTILAWGAVDKPLEITVPQMQSLVELFPRAELLATPTRAAGPKPVNFPWPVKPELVEDIHNRAAVLKLPRRNRREIGNDALQLWLDANPEPT